MNRRLHVVPLSARAVAILKSTPGFLNGDLVLTSTGTTLVSGFGRLKERLALALSRCTRSLSGNNPTPDVAEQVSNKIQENVVPGGGIEPPTRGFSIRCSTPELPGHLDQDQKACPWGTCRSANANLR